MLASLSPQPLGKTKLEKEERVLQTELSDEQCHHLERLKKRLKTNRLLNQYQEINEQFFGFNLTHASKRTMLTLLGLLAQGNNALLTLNVRSRDQAFFQNMDISTSLTEAEHALFELLLRSFTLKHATNAIEPILSSGKMMAVRELEAQGKSGARHTSKQQGVDRSLYFTFGINEHKSPSFLKNASHLITVDLDALQQHEPLAIERLWVSNHLTEYHHETLYAKQIGNIAFSMQYNKDHTKIYRFHYANGALLEWKLNYQDELFAAQDVVPGIALHFLLILRLLGGKTNPLVNKLYESSIDPIACQSLLEKMFNTLMPGWMFPEAKIIGELNIHSDYVSIHKLKESRPTSLPMNDEALLSAIKRNSLINFELLLEQGTPPLNKSKQLFQSVLKNITDQNLRLQFFERLIQRGFNPNIRVDNKSVLHIAGKKGTAADLDYLLSSKCPDIAEPLIQDIPNPNQACEERYSDFIDLIDIVCASQVESLQKLNVLKAHGANFKKLGYDYLKTVIETSDIHSFRTKYKELEEVYAILQFLNQEGVCAYNEARWGKTPLMMACEQGDLLIAKFLIENMGAQVNEQLKTSQVNFLQRKVTYNSPSDGMTALHFAAQSLNTDLITYLINEGADVGAATVDGRLPKDMNTKQLPQLEHPSSLREITIKPPKYPVSQTRLSPNQKVAVMVSGLNKNGVPYVVLGKRFYDHENESNYYCFPGGSADPLDSSILAAAQRELFEETAIDLNKIPQAKITEISCFDDFQAEEHESTTLFHVDVGNYPLILHACDDLVEAIAIPLPQLMVDPTQVNMMQYKGIPILGSNALLINYSLLQRQTHLTTIQTAAIKERLHLETDGYQMLVNIIKENRASLLPDSTVWEQIKWLLANKVHLQKGNCSLSIEMLQANPIAGMSLLCSFGVDLDSERGYFNVNEREYYASPLYYTAITNQLDVMKHLLSLGATLAYDESRLLAMAAQHGNHEMLDFLINHGLNPNRSYRYDMNLDDGGFIYPITGMAIKNQQNDLVAQIIKAGHIFINQERSPKDRDTALITAITHYNKEAAKILLASGRLDVGLSNKPDSQRVQAVTALELAQEAGWTDVYSIIEWMSHYTDMNHYLKQKGFPLMDAFQHTYDERQNPTIHFYAADKEKIKVLLEKIRSTATIHESPQGFYVRLGRARLALLFEKDQKLTKFFLNYTADSIIWMVKPPIYQKLQRELITNALNELDTEILPPLQHPLQAPFTQLGRECVSLNKVRLFINKEEQKHYGWLFNALNGHEYIREVAIGYEQYNELMEDTHQVAGGIFQCMSTLPSLNTVMCHDLPIDILIQLIMFWTNNCPEKRIKLQINASYSQDEYNSLLSTLSSVNWQGEIEYGSTRLYSPVPNEYPAEQAQEQLDELTLTNQVNYFSQKYLVFAMRANELTHSTRPIVLSHRSNEITEDKLANHALDKLALQQANITHLFLNNEFCTANLARLCKFIENSSAVESISLSYIDDAESLIAILKSMDSSPSKISHLGLHGCSFNEQITKALIPFIKKHTLIQMDFGFSKFKISDMQMLKLSETIARSPYLTALSIDYCKFEQPMLLNFFLIALMTSDSLLELMVDNYYVDKGFQQKINECLLKNGKKAFDERQLSSVPGESNSQDLPSSMHRFFSLTRSKALNNPLIQMDIDDTCLTKR
ncbi:MAG: ankyrin repeat domain-containing protein [Legionella sp.]|uniref:ankyrin repeat domain-containing protein n=1 Tax=Legionella sp. TaxID=459 RepID=UPI00283F3FBF|nr:ankyrin repeat domain-containing protein [Legionella sp.]